MGCYWLLTNYIKPFDPDPDGATDAMIIWHYHHAYFQKKLDERISKDWLLLSINWPRGLREHEQNENKSRKHLEFELRQRTRD